jgi:hypothetical protein
MNDYSSPYVMGVGTWQDVYLSKAMYRFKIIKHFADTVLLIIVI